MHGAVVFYLKRETTMSHGMKKKVKLLLENIFFFASGNVIRSGKVLTVNNKKKKC
jgi:hypothetical protein